MIKYEYEKKHSTIEKSINSISLINNDLISHSLNMSYGSKLLPPPNPLIQRNFIPLNSPKFGKNSNYIKLKPFSKVENQSEPLNVPLTDNKNITEKIDKLADLENNTPEKFEKFWDLEAYVNSSQFLGKLVYLKNEKQSGRINLENIVNLKKKQGEGGKYKEPTSYYTVSDPTDNTLIFESRFESGNLLAVAKKSEFEYILLVQNDTNTTGYSQWFFFRVTNTKANTTYHFNIINLQKATSLYNHGMKVLVYSENHERIFKVGWHRSCKNIQYYRNGIYKIYNERKRLYSSLVFSYESRHDNDTVFFSNLIPYTYTDLMKELNTFDKDEKKYNYVIRKSLCTTLADNSLDYITITTQDRNTNKNYLTRPAVILMARVHPGECVSSWMMRGVLDYLTSDLEEVKYLRNNFMFKIIPMLNPDGVINGNYRTSLAGCDLNRRWANPSDILHPEIYYAKNMILKQVEKREIALICDLHGHSARHNVFIYGNNIEEKPLSCKMFPYILSKVSPIFNFGYCNFKMQKSKKGTARINLFDELDNIPNVFTMEASFSGQNYGSYNSLHNNTNLLKSIGQDLCKSLLVYYNKEFIQFNVFGDETKTESFIPFLTGELDEQKSEIVKDVVDNFLNGNKVLDLKLCNEDSEGSDSEPSVDNLDLEDLKKLMPTKAKFNKRKKKRKLTFNYLREKKVLEPPQKIESQKNVPVLPKPIPLPLFSKSVDRKTSIKSPRALEKKNEDKLKADVETQTEEIFFKLPWTYFRGKNYKIMSSNEKKPDLRMEVRNSKDGNTLNPISGGLLGGPPTGFNGTFNNAPNRPEMKSLPNSNEKFYSSKLQNPLIKAESLSNSNNMNDILSMINNAKIINNLPQSQIKNASIKGLNLKSISPNKPSLRSIIKSRDGQRTNSLKHSTDIKKKTLMHSQNSLPQSSEMLSYLKPNYYK